MSCESTIDNELHVHAHACAILSFVIITITGKLRSLKVKYRSIFVTFCHLKVSENGSITSLYHSSPVLSGFVWLVNLAETQPQRFRKVKQIVKIHQFIKYVVSDRFIFYALQLVIILQKYACVN